jgi:hypothetical protein
MTVEQIEERVDAKLASELAALSEQAEGADARADAAAREWERLWDRAMAYRDEFRQAEALGQAEQAQANAVGARRQARRLRERLELLESDAERRRRLEARKRVEEVREQAKQNGHAPAPRPRKTDRGSGTPEGPRTDEERALYALSRGELRRVAGERDLSVSGHKITLVRRLLDAGYEPGEAA